MEFAESELVGTRMRLVIAGAFRGDDRLEVDSGASGGKLTEPRARILLDASCLLFSWQRISLAVRFWFFWIWGRLWHRPNFFSNASICEEHNKLGFIFYFGNILKENL